MAKESNDPSSQWSMAELSRQLDSLLGDRSQGDIEEHPNRIGQQFGKYRILLLAGSGAFGMVYQAVENGTNKWVAIKFPRRELFDSGESLQRFELEASAAKRLRHPAIVEVYETVLDAKTPYIVSEFCSGPDLGQWLHGNSLKTLPETKIARFLLSLCRGVQYAHELGVIHRDIKPSNVLLVSSPILSPLFQAQPGMPLRKVSEGTKHHEQIAHVQAQPSPDTLDDFAPKLTDFGLAKLTEEPILHSRSSAIIGTPMYMAPEQLVPIWGPISNRADIYSLGMLLYELAEGKSARHGLSYSEILASLLKEGQGRVQWTRDASASYRNIVG
jgi:serine/threonine protein kinase